MTAPDLPLNRDSLLHSSLLPSENSHDHPHCDPDSTQYSPLTNNLWPFEGQGYQAKERFSVYQHHPSNSLSIDPIWSQHELTQTTVLTTLPASHWFEQAAVDQDPSINPHFSSGLFPRQQYDFSQFPAEDLPELDYDEFLRSPTPNPPVQDDSNRTWSATSSVQPAPERADNPELLGNMAPPKKTYNDFSSAATVEKSFASAPEHHPSTDSIEVVSDCFSDRTELPCAEGSPSLPSKDMLETIKSVGGTSTGPRGEDGREGDGSPQDYGQATEGPKSQELTPEQAKPHSNGGRGPGKGRQRRCGSGASSPPRRRIPETPKAVAHNATPPAVANRTRSKGANVGSNKRKAGELPTAPSKRVAVEHGETVNKLSHSSQQSFQQPLSPSTASSLHDGSLSVSQVEAERDVDDKSLSNLDAEDPLDDKVISHCFKKLADMVPCTVRVIDSLGKAVPDSDYSWHQHANSKSATTPITLVPVHIKASDSFFGHWVLAVLDSNGIRILDSLPAVEHTRAATEKIRTLFHGMFTLTGPITKVRVPQASSANSGIAIFWSAVYVIGLSHGVDIHLPETFDPAPWRVAMASFLRATAGQSYNIPWFRDIEPLTVTLGHKQIVRRLLSSFSTDTETLTINPNSFIEDLRQQILLTEQTKKDVKVKRTGVLRFIRMFLGGLMEATAKEKAMLETKEKDYQVCLETVIDIEKCWGKTQVGRLAHENVQGVQACEGLRQDMALKTSKVVGDIDHDIKELENT